LAADCCDLAYLLSARSLVVLLNVFDYCNVIVVGLSQWLVDNAIGHV